MVTQAQTTLPQETLPPNARDFEAYRLVKVEKQSTRAVAKLLRISQTRVCQVVDRVAVYLVEVTPPESEARREQQLAVAKQVAAAQIDHCMKRALHSYDRSCTKVQTVREVESAGQITRITTTRENFGETRYLTAVARLAVISSTLPTCTLPIAVRRSADEIQADAETNGVEETAPEAVHPSEEACSADAGEQPVPQPLSAADEAARLEAIKLYNRGMRMLNRPETQLPETVQPAESTVPFERLRQTVAASTQAASSQQSEWQRKLSRRERRKQRSATAAS